MDDKTGTIDYAIKRCEDTISKNRFQSGFFLGLMIIIPVFAGAFFYIESLHQKEYKSRLMMLAEKVSSNPKSEAISKLSSEDHSNLILYALLILVFGVFTSLYRFHLKEIAKYEHFLLGFMRIRIAANNSEQGFNSEVRGSLTHEAFTYETKSSLINTEKKIESPIPGYPTSDLSTGIINKILDSIEVVAKKKN